MLPLVLIATGLGLVPLSCHPRSCVLHHAYSAVRLPAISASADATGGDEPTMPDNNQHQRSLISRVSNYVAVQIVRPLFVHVLIANSYIVRHAITRSSQRKAEFASDASRITWIGALVNLVLAVFKAVAGIYGRSAAMIADAAHSFSDLFSDGLTLLSLRMSALPADVDHPYGHGRFESVGSLAIGSILLGVGFSFGASALNALRSPIPTPLGRIALWAALVSIVSKEMLFQATVAIGRRTRSQVLIANAWHHRSDALSSVVAFAGIAGSLLGWRVLDPIAGIVVAALVSWMGLKIALEALSQLTDTSDYGVVQAVDDVARSVVGVEGVDQIRSRSMGGSVLVDLAIQVDPRLSASSAHRLAEEVRVSVLDEVPERSDVPVSEVLVHVDTAPHDFSCPLQTSVLAETRAHHVVEEDVAAQLCSLAEVTEVPRVQVFYLEEGLAVEAHCRMLEHLTVTELRDVARRGREALLDNSPDITSASVSLDLSERWSPASSGSNLSEKSASLR